MKVLHVITHFDLGGAERVAVNIAKSKSEDFSYSIVEVAQGTSAFSEAMKKELKASGIKYYCSPIKNLKLAILLFPVWFLPVYLKIRPQIIHSHTESPDLALWLFRKIAWLFFWIRPKYVRTIHNTLLWDKWGKIGDVVELYYIRHNCNVAISHSTLYSYCKRYDCPKPPIIYNGVEEVPQKTFPGLKKNKLNILFAGRLEYQKGIDQLIAVIKALKEDQHFFFTVVGKGSLHDKMMTEIGNFDNVEVHDQVFRLSQYLFSFDYLFMPSNHEGLGLISVEASLAHTPPIINTCPGLDETLPTDWLLAVENNSVEDYIELFRTVLPTINYDAVADEAYDFAKKHFSIERMQKEYESFYSCSCDE